MAVGPLEALTSTPGALALAIAALLLALGLRLAPRQGAAARAAAAAYAASLAVTLLGGLGILPGPAFAAPLPLRLVGAAAIFAGLLTAGALAGRRGPREPRRATWSAAPRRRAAVHGGLALVLLGQLLRAPSAAGALGLAAAALVHGWAAWSPRRAGV